MDFCKEKITVFPEGTLFAKALLSAKLLLSVGYGFVAFSFHLAQTQHKCLPIKR